MEIIRCGACNKRSLAKRNTSACRLSAPLWGNKPSEGREPRTRTPWSVSPRDSPCKQRINNTTRSLIIRSILAWPGQTSTRGDCLAVIPGIDGLFDAVVTDPPYSSGGQSKGNRAASTGAKYLNTGSTQWPDFAGDSKDQRSYLHWSALWMALCYEKLNPTAA